MKKKLKRLIADVADVLAETEREDYSGTLRSFDEHKVEVVTQFRQTLEKFASDYLDGYELLFRELLKRRDKDAQLAKALPVSQFTVQVPKKRTATTPRNPFDEPLQEELGLSNLAIHHMYQIACEWGQIAEYEKAVQAFTFLTYVCADRYQIWISLGRVYELMLDPASACMAYQSACISDPEQLICYDNAVRLLCDTDQFEVATKLVEGATQLTEQYEHNEELQAMKPFLAGLSAHIEQRQNGGES